MSQTNTDKTPTVVAVPENGAEVVESEKQNFFQRRVVAPIKKHPKIATAIVAGVALVGTAAYLGKGSDPEPMYLDTLSEDERQQLEVLVAEAEDTTVA